MRLYRMSLWSRYRAWRRAAFGARVMLPTASVLVIRGRYPERRT